jgi:hypothetical protein
MLAAQALASESFVLQIPKRNVTNQEIGEVRINLGLDLPPAGAQLVIGGTTTLNLGDTTSVAGDEVTFAEGAGNSVNITYRPLSNFGAEFCAGENTVEKNVPIRFSGTQDVATFRLSTYVVAAPQQDACAKVSRRTGELPAIVIPEPDAETQPLDAIFRGRHELDVILVLDKSGSMVELPPGASTGPTKAELLRSALTTFVAQWKELDAPFEGGFEFPGDRIGIVFFDSTASPQTITGGDPPQSFFVQRSLAAASPHPWDEVVETIDTLVPGSTTALGRGINSAMEQWQADADNDLTLVVVTDGKQNVAPLIAAGASGLLELQPDEVPLPAALADRYVPIQTIGFGTPAAVDETLLTGISAETAGLSLLAVDSETIFEAFAFTLVGLLKGNTASLASRFRGATTGEHAVIVDRSAQRVVFSLQWAPPDEDMLALEIFRPGSNVPAVPSSSTLTKQAVLHSFDTSDGDVGEWRMRVTRRGSATMEVPYTLNTFFSERHLDYRLSFDTVRTLTGHGIRLRASVAYDGKPLKGLPPNAIRVTVRRPSEGLGTILHNAKFPAGDSSSSDPQSPYQQKTARVVDAAVLARILPRNDVTTIPFVEEKDGTYSATFADTSVPGAYAFEVVLEWDDKRTGRLHREERLERHVMASVDAARSEVTRRGMQVTITPRDRFGNYLGPGYATFIRVNGASVDSVDKDQTGTYVLTAADGADITVYGVKLNPPAPAPSTWRVFIAAGPNFPEWSVNAGVERLLSPDWSVEGILGWHRRQNDDLTQISLGAKKWFGKAFVNAGAGAYEGEVGVHVGAGVLCGKWEGVVNYHRTDDDKFFTAQVGVRF